MAIPFNVVLRISAQIPPCRESLPEISHYISYPESEQRQAGILILEYIFILKRTFLSHMKQKRNILLTTLLCRERSDN